jgi:hypothetical protein
MLSLKNLDIYISDMRWLVFIFVALYILVVEM